jgi:hypothetical protein
MNNLLTGLITSEEGMAFGIFMMIMFFVILVCIGLYIYTSLALMAIAKKTKTEPAWLAWIPIANLVLLSRIAKMHWWPILLTIPAFIFLGTGFVFLVIGQNVIGIILIVMYGLVLIPLAVYSTIWYWKMFEAVNRPGWWSLTSIVPSVVYLLLTLTQSVILTMLGAIISFGGAIMFFVLFGISAWSDAPKTAAKYYKKNINK